MSSKELDTRISKLPPCYGVRHFKNGISHLLQVSGPERKQIAHVLLACLVGKVPKRALVAIRSLLDFTYLSQYASHDEVTLGYLKDVLNVYYEHMDAFITYGCRKHLNIPKFHSLRHYLDSIPHMGTTDNYNTEMFERLHIDFAKKGWRASNHRDDETKTPAPGFPQMIRWLSRQEKMSAHHCPSFSAVLKTYLNSLMQNPQRRQNAIQDHFLPFTRVDVFTSIKLFLPKIGEESSFIQETIKARPQKSIQPHQFDTVIVYQNEDAKSTGLIGMRIGRIRVIFLLPRTIDWGLGPKECPSSWPSEPLAFIHLYDHLSTSPNSDSMMYTVKYNASQEPAIIVPLSHIRQSCMLIPKLPRDTNIPDHWNTYNVMDECSIFLLNNFKHLYTYQTVW
ncbi:hypothetical protein FISHEDRAFT_43836 [Fistulina hepatica ATCC 64428]|uniref:Uncharacterized protein n=1 Tax=Fistulina hepatica ATCC 64428 TaxID=1128425 RepID=A0A0D7ACK7_9AGAR|nr:hypothetical protein FISHEDRAFT_43836 [Fistulina hepatica ATCC 64428]